MPKCALVVAVLSISTAGVAAEPFTGVWQTTFGPVELRQTGDAVAGKYSNGRAKIVGKVAGEKLTFTYFEPAEQGEGWFELGPNGAAFKGLYLARGAKEWHAWDGKRSDAKLPPPAKPGFAGLWDTTFGRLRLLQTGDKVEGVYAFASGSSVQGTVEGDKLTFTYAEPDAAGEGEFRLGANGASFAGRWRPTGTPLWLDWSGKRIEQDVARTWLVVLEAHFEEELQEPEYSFGQMLKAYFSRTPNVQVRHRFFHDEADLRRWCGELAYFNEPVVLSVASHGNSKGVSVGTKTFGPKPFVETLRFAPELKLLHFSACDVMADDTGLRISRGLQTTASAAVSGYTTSVDWGASAVIEFMYFDLVCARGMEPAEAAKQIKLLMPFAGDRVIPGATLSPAGFRMVLPEASDSNAVAKDIGSTSRTAK